MCTLLLICSDCGAAATRRPASQHPVVRGGGEFKPVDYYNILVGCRCVDYSVALAPGVGAVRRHLNRSPSCRLLQRTVVRMGRIVRGSMWWRPTVVRRRRIVRGSVRRRSTVIRRSIIIRGSMRVRPTVVRRRRIVRGSIRSKPLLCEFSLMSRLRQHAISFQCVAGGRALLRRGAFESERPNWLILFYKGLSRAHAIAASLAEPNFSFCDTD